MCSALGCIIPLARATHLDFPKLSRPHTQCPEPSVSYKSVLVTRDVNASHLRPFHKVCSQPQRLELDPLSRTFTILSFEMSTIARPSSPTLDKLDAETAIRARACSENPAIES